MLILQLGAPTSPVRQVITQAQQRGAVFRDEGEPFRCAMRALSQVQMGLQDAGVEDVVAMKRTAHDWIQRQGDRWWLSLPLLVTDGCLTTHMYDVQASALYPMPYLTVNVSR